ncbi:MAG: glycogen debranching protein GlgX [Candidatus Hydrogenedentes bacterium]|nr:glycogen debranching protein GlgX [Candidatus Hydrogenedentota bacterium]
MREKTDYTKLRVIPGRPYPVGPAVYDSGIRFTVFSRHARRVWLALFDGPDDTEPAWEYELDPARHRTGDMWSVFVENLREDAYYLFRMAGPWDPKRGHRFNPRVYLLDPYAKALVGDIHRGPGFMKCVAVYDRMDWPDDVRPRIPMADLVIYEAHVRGFTRHPSSGAAHPGTYRGLIEKIPHLKALGVNAVELLPVHETGEYWLGRCSVITGKELTNYWGYSTIGFFAPTGRYAVRATDSGHLEEFRGMVRALHAAGIEVILDVVFNHTSEGNAEGPTLSFKGLDNTIYYLMRDGEYLNFSGCGNTVNCNHPLVRDFILDSLRYWTAAMHVDGFRFDLASILGRDQQGHVQEDSPLLARIAEDPVLRDVKLIAEAWDAGGAYQVGSFGGSRWAEWNGMYRDDTRRFWRGDPGMAGAFATRLAGSEDLYARSGRTPLQSINFVTCHDGFTLADLWAHNLKHNAANGEGNRDGQDENFSWNCGAEGPVDNPDIRALRLRMQKNLAATLFLSAGVPMMLGGDEFGRTQQGNNNAYCQDNEISWMDWSLAETNAELLRFFRGIIRFRAENPGLRRKTFYRGDGPEGPDLAWRGPDGGPPRWEDGVNTLACVLHPRENAGTAVFMAFNAAAFTVSFRLPDGNTWRKRVDTGAASPMDMTDGDGAPEVTGEVLLAPRSLVVLTRKDG